jgi:hypothetical protein
MQSLTTGIISGFNIMTLAGFFGDGVLIGGAKAARRSGSSRQNIGAWRNNSLLITLCRQRARIGEHDKFKRAHRGYG